MESLRLRVQELESRPAPAAPAAPGSPALTSEQFLAGLEDPKVKEKLRGMSQPQGMVFRSAGPAPLLHLEGMELSPQQKESLGKLLSEHQSRVEAILRRRMTEKDVPPARIQEELEKAWADVDAQVQTQLSYTQFEDYRKRVGPPRKLLTSLVQGAPKGGGIYMQQMLIETEDGGKADTLTIETVPAPAAP